MRVREFLEQSAPMFRTLCLCLLSCFLWSCASRSGSDSDLEPRYFVHEIRYAGETLGAIASWYTGSSANWERIVSSNPGLEPRNLQIGSSIFIPEDLVVKRDALPKPARTTYLPQEPLEKADGLDPSDSWDRGKTVEDTGVTGNASSVGATSKTEGDAPVEGSVVGMKADDSEPGSGSGDAKAGKDMNSPGAAPTATERERMWKDLLAEP